MKDSEKFIEMLKEEEKGIDAIDDGLDKITEKLNDIQQSIAAIKQIHNDSNDFF